MLRILFLIVGISLYSCSKGDYGKIVTKERIDIRQLPIWENISRNDTLLPKFEYVDQIELYKIQYHSNDRVVWGLCLTPKREGKYPVIIFNRGGNRDFSALTYPFMLTFGGPIVEKGYVMIASNYRKEDEFGGSELNDVLSLYNTIEEIEKADASRIGMLGWSRGGMMTYLSMKESCKLKTAVIGNGPTDLFATKKSRPKMEKVYEECIPNYASNAKEELKERSVIYWPEELCRSTSLLILSGTQDKRVDPDQADRLSKKLDSLGYNYELIKRETDHFFTGKREELNEILLDWFDKELK